MEYYSLKIAEDGEEDSEFPALETNKFVSVFGFSQLALVENKEKISTTKPKENAKIDVLM